MGPKYSRVKSYQSALVFPNVGHSLYPIIYFTGETTYGSLTLIIQEPSLLIWRGISLKYSKITAISQFSALLFRSIKESFPLFFFSKTFSFKHIWMSKCAGMHHFVLPFSFSFQGRPPEHMGWKNKTSVESNQLLKN